MGQRLVIHIEQKDKKNAEMVELANVYMHWSAYTESAISATLDVTDVLELIDIKTFNKLSLSQKKKIIGTVLMQGLPGSVMRPASFKAAYGRGMTKEEQEKLNRNKGLISIDKDDIDSANSWSEGDVTITIPTKDTGKDLRDSLGIGFGVIFIEDNDTMKENEGDKWEQTVYCPRAETADEKTIDKILRDEAISVEDLQALPQILVDKDSRNCRALGSHNTPGTYITTID
jgi:hypothetical protein